MYLPGRLWNASNVIVKRVGRPVILSVHGTLASADKSLSRDDIDKLVKSNKVVIFMKGCPEQPMCGFSNAVVQILRMHNVQYDSHNVLENDSLRNGIKEYSKWPTIPQVFIDGQFVGGCDILLQMHQSGELIEQLQKAGITSALLSKAMGEEPK